MNIATLVLVGVYNWYWWEAVVYVQELHTADT